MRSTTNFSANLQVSGLNSRRPGPVVRAFRC